MQKEIIILAGISGSGKSTLARGYSGTICSADEWMVDANGNYAFDYRRLSVCHNESLLKFIRATEVEKTPYTHRIVVDNTNTTLHEIAPYAQIALARGHVLKVIALVCDPIVAFTRNVHGVDTLAILHQNARLQKTIVEAPPWWNLSVEFTE